MTNLISGLTALIGGGADALDSLDGNALTDGDAVIVRTSTGVYNYYLDATSGATENSPYVISPDSNAGTKRWILITPNAPFSYIYAKQSTLQTVANETATSLICQTETEDVLSEYNNATGEFTATYTGKYAVSAAILTDTYAWTGSEFCSVQCFIEGVLFNIGPRSYPGTTARGTCYYSCIIPLAASEVLTMRFYHNQGGNVDTAIGNATWIAIHRMS